MKTETVYWNVCLRRVSALYALIVYLILSEQLPVRILQLSDIILSLKARSSCNWSRWPQVRMPPEARSPKLQMRSRRTIGSKISPKRERLHCHEIALNTWFTCRKSKPEMECLFTPLPTICNSIEFKFLEWILNEVSYRLRVNLTTIRLLKNVIVHPDDKLQDSLSDLDLQ